MPDEVVAENENEKEAEPTADGTDVPSADVPAAATVHKDYYEKLSDLVADKLVFPLGDRKAMNAWHVYKPSEQTELLQTEEGRAVYSEAFDFQTKANLSVQSLKMLAIMATLRNYKGGAVDECIQLTDKIWFGENLSCNMPIENLIHLDVRASLDYHFVFF